MNIIVLIVHRACHCLVRVECPSTALVPAQQQGPTNNYKKILMKIYVTFQFVIEIEFTFY